MTELNDSTESLAERLAALEGRMGRLDEQYRQVRTLLVTILLEADPLNRIAKMRGLLEMGIGKDVIEEADRLIRTARQQETDTPDTSGAGED